jgi:hypothetical protein
MVPGVWGLTQVLSLRLKNDTEQSEIAFLLILQSMCEVLSASVDRTEERLNAALNGLNKQISEALKRTQAYDASRP